MIAYAVLIGLASYRIWRITGEDKITEWFREWLYLTTTVTGDGRIEDRKIKAWFADLFSCPWCWGWWVAGILAGLVSWHQGYDLVTFVLLWTSGSTIAGATHVVVDRMDR